MSYPSEPHSAATNCRCNLGFGWLRLFAIYAQVCSAGNTTREGEIFDRIVDGESNKAIALDLGIGIRTVESHRANIMQKLKARTLADLVHIALRPNRGIEPPV